MKNIKVAFLAKYLPPFRGGMETVTESLCRGLKQKGFHVSLIGVQKGKTSKLDCCDQLIGLNSPGHIFSQPLFLPTSRMVRALADADVVIHNFPHPLLDAYCESSTQRAKSIVIFHSEIHKNKMDYFVRPLSERLLVAADAIAVSSPQHLQFSTVSKYSSKTQVIPFGTEYRCQSTKEDDFILGVGRLVSYKGFEYLIEAMKEIRSRLIIVGDGPQLRALQKQAAKFGDRVLFLQNVDESHLHQLYQHCKVFVLPSITQQETFGLSLIEAMSFGKPVVTTDIQTGVGFVNENGITGLVAEPKDSVDLAVKINMLLENRSMRLAMGCRSYSRARNVFNIDQMIDGYEKLIYKVLQGSLAPELRF